MKFLLLICCSLIVDFAAEIQHECDRRGPGIQRRGPQEDEEPITPTTPTPAVAEAENLPLLVTNSQRNPFFPPIPEPGPQHSPPLGQGMELDTLHGNNTEQSSRNTEPQEISIDSSLQNSPERSSKNPQGINTVLPQMVLPRTLAKIQESTTEGDQNYQDSHDPNLCALNDQNNQTHPKLTRTENSTRLSLEIPNNVVDTQETNPKQIPCERVCRQTQDNDLVLEIEEDNNIQNQQEIHTIVESEVQVPCPNCGDPQNVPNNVVQFVCTKCSRKFSVGVSAERDGERECGRGQGLILQSQARDGPTQGHTPPQYMALGIESNHPGYSLLGTSPLAIPEDATQTYVKTLYDDVSSSPADRDSVDTHTVDQSYEATNDSNSSQQVECQIDSLPDVHRVTLQRGNRAGLYLVMPQNQRGQSGSAGQNNVDIPNEHSQAQNEGRPASDPLPMSPVQESPGPIVSEATVDDTSQPLIGQRRITVALYRSRSQQNFLPNTVQTQPQDVQAVYGIMPRQIPENGDLPVGDGQIELGIAPPAGNDSELHEGNHLGIEGEGGDMVAQQGNDSGTSSGVSSEGTGSLESSHESLQDTVALATSSVSRSTSEDTDSGLVDPDNQEHGGC